MTDLPRFGAVMRGKITTACDKAQFCFDLATRINEKLDVMITEENQNKKERKLLAEIKAEDAIKDEKQRALLALEINRVSHSFPPL